jgi:hypothetical protein
VAGACIKKVEAVLILVALSLQVVWAAIVLPMKKSAGYVTTPSLD